MGTGFGDRTLVIGAAGMLGRAVCAALDSDGLAYDAVDAVPDDDAGIGRFDLCADDDLAKIADGGWATVVNCAAWTDVDGAEEKEEAATVLNGHAVGALAGACREGGALCVHYSTDYVFDGNGSSPYPVDHAIDPINAYGRSKAVGERLLAESGAEHILIRTSWLYGPWGKNFVLTMRSLMQSRDVLKVVDDQRGRPTSVEQLARTTIGLVNAGARGTFHGSDGGECTWHGFASAIRDTLGLTTKIDPCTTDEFPRPAARPAYSVLDLSTTTAIVGEPIHWEDELRRVLGVVQSAEQAEPTQA
jgi:dTDP-4-dehydrorhamnose reductase